MAFVPATNIVEVFIEHSFAGKEGVGWVVHYETNTPPWTPLLMGDLALSIVGWWDTYMQPLMAGSASLQRIRMRDLTTATSGVLDYSTGLPLVGSRAGAAMPANVSLSVKKNTGFAGRSLRGRIYMFGMVEGDVTANFIESGYSNAVLAAWDEALFFAGAEAEYGMVLVSKYSGGSPRPSALVTDVTSVSLADTRVDTRRDRL